MGAVNKLISLFFVTTAISIGYFIHVLNKEPDFMLVLEDKYWGPGQHKQDDTTIKPFIINITNSELQDLKERLNRWRPGAEALEGVQFQYGFHRQQLKDLVEYWKTKYNWRTREKILNSLNQFKTQISGLDIHFIHQKPKNIPKGVEVLPLLLLHGWPSTVKDFYNVIPLLTTPKPGNQFVFEVIVPSLPGFAWSQGASKPGLSTTYTALIMNKLMLRLGFNKYYTQGGDWGSIVAAEMSVYFPQNIIGYHSNLCIHLNRWNRIKMWANFAFPWLYNDDHKLPLELGNQIFNFIEESGYFHIQATKPDTVGAGLSDSPVGLAAYILEKYLTGINPLSRTKQDGGISNYQYDDLLDNVMIYWLSNSITTSMRYYAENQSKQQHSLGVAQYPITVPTGCARFPSAVFLIPKKLLKEAYRNLIWITDMPKGGHFAAFEEPQLLADDIWSFTDKVRRYYKKKDEEKLQITQNNDM